MIQLDHFFWGVETIVPSTQRVILPAFLLNPIPVFFASASHVGRAMKLGLLCLPGISLTKKPIGIIFTYQKCRSGRRQSTWTLGFVAPFEALEVLDALRKHWLEQSLGPMHEPSPVPGLQEEISAGWGWDLGGLNNETLHFRPGRMQNTLKTSKNRIVMVTQMGLQRWSRRWLMFIYPQMYMQMLVWDFGIDILAKRISWYLKIGFGMVSNFT